MALADNSKWKYVLTAINGTIPVGAGEIVWADQKTFSDNLNGVRTASVTVNNDHPRLPWLLNNYALLKVYRRGRDNNWSLRMVGDVVTTEERGDGTVEQVVITAVDPLWRILKRLLGMAVGSNGQATGFTIGSPSSPVDLSVILEQILQQVNSDFPTGVSIGSIVNSGTTSVVGPLYAVFAGAAMQQISSVLGAPDFWIAPLEPSGTMPNTVVGQLNVQSQRGTTRPNAIFEYGYGKHNVDSYDRLRTRQNQANHGVALPTGWPTSIGAGDHVAVYDDTASQNTASRVDDIMSSDVASYQLRQILVQEAVQVRTGYQQQINFQPSSDNPVDYGVDYDVGDIVTARAYNTTTQTFRYNGTVRVYGVSFTIDQNDAESPTLTLIPS